MFSNVAHYTLLCLFGKIHGTQKSNTNLNSLVFDELHWFGLFLQKKERVCIFVTVACNPTKSIKRSCPTYFFIVDMKQNYFLQIYIRMAHSWMLLFKNETYVA